MAKATIRLERLRARKVAIPESITRIGKYIMMRTAAIGIALVIGIYLTIIIANMGGYVDEMRRGQIKEAIAMKVHASEELRLLPKEKREAIIKEWEEIEIRRLGLDKPFILRSFSYLGAALSLNLGRAEHLTSDSGSRQVRLIILERLPATLVVFGTADLMLFFGALFFALFLSRRYGSALDKVTIALTPTSAGPSWFYGLILIAIFSALLHLLPFGGMIDVPPPETKLGYALSLIKHLILPVSAILISAIFVTIYNWRTFFLIHSSEDYVEMAKAKGLPSRIIERRYVLRPTLPPIITSFALTLIAMWTGGIILETVFSWPGLGRLFYMAIGHADTPVIVGEVVIYAYLLAMTVLILDILYALLDPRVKVGA